MRKIVATLVVVFCAALTVAKPIESSKEAIFILLNTSGTPESNANGECWNSALRSYIQSSITGGEGTVYCGSYSIEKTPKVFVDEFAGPANGESILAKALEYWFENSDDERLAQWKSKATEKTLAALKRSGRDIIPLQYVVVANGASGLVAREYIQSSDYNGEISNVLFFDTPHEGTGFADQALFNAAKTTALNKSASSESLSSIIPLALTAYIVGSSDELQNLLIDLLKNAVVGMAYDMGGDASKSMEEAGVFSDFSSVDNPALWYLSQDADMDDPKYKDLREKVVGVDLDESLGGTQLLNAYSKNNGFDHPSYNVMYSVGFPTIGNGRRTLDDFSSRAKNHVTAAAREKIKNELEQVSSDDLKKIEELSKIRLNKDDIPGSVINAISILEKFIPEPYKSELYSNIVDNFSPKVVSDITEAAKDGLSSVATSMAGYSLNFFDQGVFDVPTYSAIGENVAAFKDAGVSRTKYSLPDIVKKNDAYGNLREYQNLLESVGELEKNRKIVDVGLNAGCEVLAAVNVGYGEVCRAAEFAVNVGLIAETSKKLDNIAKRSGDLKNTKDVALWASFNMDDTVEVYSFKSDKMEPLVFKKLDSRLFGEPHVSFASMRRENKVYPYVLKSACNDEVCPDEDFVYSIDLDKFAKADLNSDLNSRLVTIKDVTYEEGGTGSLYKRSNYGAGMFQNLYATSHIQEFRFVIDDLQPDSLWWVRLDFNTRVQVGFQRVTNGKWEVWYGTSYSYKRVGEITESPVNQSGLFKFRPKDVVDMYNGIYPDRPIGVAAFFEDGANMVKVAAMNKIGRTNGQSFSFYLQATQLKLQETWPHALDIVSTVGAVYAELDDLGYPVQSSGARLRISLVVDGDTKIRDSVEVDISLKTHDPENGNTYSLSADLSSLFNKYPLFDGFYKVEWVFSAAPAGAEDSRPVEYVKTSYFYVDQKAPDLQVSVPNVNLKGNVADGAWANIQSLDSASDRATRALRAFVFNKKDGGSDTTFLVHKTNYAGKYLDVRWDENDVSRMRGMDTLVVQAYDFANPNEGVREALQDVAADSGRSSWNVVLKDGTFIKGINGTTVKVPVWVDNAAPSVFNRSIYAAKSVAEKNHPDTCWKELNALILLGMSDTLKVAFDVVEDLLGRESEEVRVRLLFSNASTGQTRTFEESLLDTTGLNHFEFVEPEANRLVDGIYTVQAELEDAAGNVSSVLLADGVVVDRTAPVITAVFSNGLRFSSVDDLNNVNGYVSQDRDLAENRTRLACYTKVSSGNLSTEWFFVGVESGSLKGGDARMPYSLSNFVDSLPVGYWTVHFGCADALGNFGEFVDVIELGARYPEIVTPSDSVNELYYGKILIRGVAANPILNGGDDRQADFRLDWRAIDSTEWHIDSLMYLTSGVNVSTRSLAIWNVDGLEGEYVLRLSVCGCQDSIVCPWVSAETIVSVYARSESGVPNDAPTIEVAPPEQHVVGVLEDVAVELRGTTDTSLWTLNIEVFVQDPSDSLQLAAGMPPLYIDPVSVSPFPGKPSEFPEGLSIWQDIDGRTWNLHWKGSAEGVRDSITGKTLQPSLRLKYVGENVDFVQGAPDDVDNSSSMSSIEVDDVTMPAFDQISRWNLDAEREFDVSFVTDSSFTVDLSTVNEGSEKVFCGKNSVSADKVIEYFRGVPVLYVNPNQYKVKFAYDGLTQGGLYPSGNKVLLKAYAYDKDNPTHVITAQKEWTMQQSVPQLTTNMARDTGDFYIAVGDSSETPLSKKNVGFYFGLKGYAACVTAKVVDSRGDTIATILDGMEPKLASSSDSAYFVSWNGFSQDRFVVDTTGLFKIHMEATNCEKRDSVISSLDYYFNVKYESMVAEAGKDSVGGLNSFPAVLSMDEAVPDTTDGVEGLRFVGRPDYLMKVNASAKYLPEEARTFEYYWDWKDGEEHIQYPAMYQKNRFSMGIWRHRDEFPVTVAVLLATTSYNLNDGGVDYCEIGDSHASYRIIVKKVTFSEYNPLSGNLSIRLDPDNDMAGFDRVRKIGRTPQNYAYPILMEVKVFPADEFDNIGRLLGYSKTPESLVFDYKGHADEESDKMIVPSYDEGAVINEILFWNRDSYRENESIVEMWLGDFESKTVYWQARSSFLYNSKNVTFVNLSLGANSCAASTVKGENAGNSVCGTETPKDVEDLNVTNVHKDMFEISISPEDGEYFTVDNDDAISECREHDSAAEDVRVSLSLVVDSKYWNPVWGTNNLANRYVRFDPTNINLYGEEGYFKTIKDDPSKKNFFNGEKWVNEYENGFVTAFETQKFPMVRSEMNPLFFADEIHSNSNKLYSSKYAARFYTTGGDPLFAVRTRLLNEFPYGEMVFSTIELEDYWFNNCSSDNQMSAGCGILPTDISFDIAPVMNPFDAVETSENFSVPYPYKNDDKNIELPKEFEKNYRFYKNFASRIHYELNDWSEDDWSEICTRVVSVNGKKVNAIRNPLTDSSIYDGFEEIQNIPNVEPVDLRHRYSLKQYDIDSDGVWVVPSDSLVMPRLDEHVYDVNPPVGVFELKSGEGNDYRWKVDYDLSTNKWIVKNPGKDSVDLLEYVFSRDHDVKYDSRNVGHEVPLSHVVLQNEHDSLFNGTWFQKGAVTDVSIYRRDKADEQHKYLQASYDVNNSKFDVTRTAIDPYNVRVDEIATLRGRVPGDSVEWKISYTKDGMIIPFAKGIQKDVPKDEPYPVFSYFDMNTLQGNTSFFLTYARGAMTYFRQLDS